jgi:AcrR family transcriptional regulator
MVTRMTSPRRRGRPVELDLDRVARVALDLFRERGYDAVTMEDIANVVGHSRRTIFRHFPAKASLVWTSMEHFVATVLGELGDADPTSEAIDAVRAAYQSAMLTVMGLEGADLLRQRLVLIGENHVLHGEAPVRLAGVGEAIRRLFVEREQLDPQGVDAAVVGDTLVLAAHQALVWWARFDDGEPGPVVDAALSRLAGGLRYRESAGR